MIKKKFKFYESEKLYTPETKEELKKLIRTPNIDFKQIDTSRITDMSELFKEFKFDREKTQKGGLQDISNWDVSNVRNMSKMFAYSSFFNQDIGGWDVSNVENMNAMFADSKFNKDISNWDVSNVKDMSYMFYDTPFNQNISNWDVSNVRNMKAMFAYSKFNQDISNWDISNVKNMEEMFYGLKFSYFNEILKNWPKIINLNCKIKEVFSNSTIQKEFENRIKKYQKLKNL